jgi:hypothetical protein
VIRQNVDAVHGSGRTVPPARCPPFALYQSIT